MFPPITSSATFFDQPVAREFILQPIGWRNVADDGEPTYSHRDDRGAYRNHTFLDAPVVARVTGVFNLIDRETYDYPDK